MKVLTKFFMFTALFAMIAVTTNAQRNVALTPNKDSKFIVLKESLNQLIVKNTVSSLIVNNIEYKKTDYADISIPQYATTIEVGCPNLPVLRKFVEVPLEAEIKVEVVSYDVKEYNLSALGINSQIAPFQESVTKSHIGEIPFSKNEKIYNTDKFYGVELASIEALGIMRDTRLARLDIAPIEYNPVSKKIKVYDNIVVKVIFNNGNYEATQALKAKTRSQYFEHFKYDVLNKIKLEPSKIPNVNSIPMKYVIVSHPMFKDSLQSFISWKIQKGFNVVEAYTDNPAVGTTATSIKAYLKNLYINATEAEPAPSFVLFVGDVAQIPASQMNVHATDLYYCEYTNDYMPEMYYGRFSANNVTELMPYIHKTLMHEKYEFPDDSFLGKALMVSGVDNGFAATHGNGQINYGHNYYFNADHGIISQNFLYPASAGAAVPAQIRGIVSEGVGYANYTAHCSSTGWADPSFAISHINQLQNINKYCVMVGNCCSSSEYNNTCFAESIVRAKNKGAVAYIGSSNSTYWNEDYWWGVGYISPVPINANPTYEASGLGAYDRAFHTHNEPFTEWYTTVDQMVFAGNKAVMTGNPARAQYYWEIYCVMGDPSLAPYFGVPQDNTAQHLPFISIGSTNFIVNTTPYSDVALTQGNELLGFARADENGLAELLFPTPINLPGEANLVITNQNKKPIFKKINIQTLNIPFIIVKAFTINDSQGNNNGLVDYSENIKLGLKLVNIGQKPMTNAKANLVSSCEYITILNPTQNLQNIAVNDSITINDMFNIQIASNIPDNTVAKFEFQTKHATADTIISSSQFSFVVNAPSIVCSEIKIIEKGGNNNGVIDANENGIAKFTMKNNGHADLLNAKGYLFSNSNKINIFDKNVSLEQLKAGETKTIDFNFKIADNVEEGYNINLFYTFGSGSYQNTATLTQSIGAKIENFESGDFSKFNWINTSPSPWTIVTTAPYEGAYCAQSGAITHSQSTVLKITLDVPNPGKISFALKTSSEAKYDKLIFKMNNTEIDTWAGNTPWKIVEYPVSAGSVTFEWQYKKDVSQSGGTDQVWIDKISFPNTNNAGLISDFKSFIFANPEISCSNEAVNLFGFAVNAPSNDVKFAWSPATNLNNANIFNPVANVAQNTEFTLNVTSGSATATSTFMLKAGEKPNKPTITRIGMILEASEAFAYQWYNGQGQAIEGATNRQYTPANTPSKYYVIVKSVAGCESDKSDLYDYVGVKDIKDHTDFNIYPNPSKDVINIDFSLNKNSDVKIMIVNTVGQVVKVKELNNLTSGSHSQIVDLNNVKSGIYTVQLIIDNKSNVRKLIINK